MEKEKFEFTHEGILAHFGKYKVIVIARILAVIIIGLASVYTSVKIFSSVKEIQGQWKFVFNTKESTYRPFIGISTGYKMFLSQKSAEITGSGEKFWENDAEIPFSQHVQLTFEGKLDGDKLLIHYTEFGKNRTTIGECTMYLNKKDSIEGFFTSTAANSKGFVTATRISK